MVSGLKTKAPNIFLTFLKYFSPSTIVTIAHRLNTVLDYDRVLVLRDGAITELDSPRALLATEGSEFRAMCQVRSRGGSRLLRVINLLFVLIVMIYRTRD